MAVCRDLVGEQGISHSLSATESTWLSTEAHPTMAEKTQRKTTAKKAERSLKEKRADKRAKSDSSSRESDAVTNVKKR